MLLTNKPKPKSKEFAGFLAISMGGFFLLFGYECIRSSSMMLFKEKYGPENLPLVMALIPVLLIILLYGYNRLLSVCGPQKTLLLSTLFSSFGILALSFATRAGFDFARGVLFIFREVYIVLLIEQYWSLFNSSYTPDFARKWNGTFTGIATIGAILGGIFVHKISVLLGTINLPLVSSLLLLPACFLVNIAYNKLGEPRQTHVDKKSHRLFGEMGLDLFQNQPVLLIILLVVVLTQVISTVSEIRFQTFLHLEVPGLDMQTAYSGQFYAILNTFSLALQFVLGPVLLKLLPLWLIFASMPLVNLGCALGALLLPSLSTAGLAFMTFKILDYSIFRMTKEILYMPLSFGARYRSKEFIDVFGYRCSKAGTSVILVMIKKLSTLTVSLYSWIALGAALGWLILIMPLMKHTKKHG